MEDIDEDVTVSNKIPENWWKEGFLLDNYTLSEFFTNFLYKLEYRETLHSFMLFTQEQIAVDLAKLFDPFSFLISILTEYSTKNQVHYH